MKGCFFLHRRFGPIGHMVARHLQDLGVKEFCAVAHPRSTYNFLLNQKDIKYTNVILLEDIYAKYKNVTIDQKYLDWLEQEYGLPNLWPYLTIDRVVMSGQYLHEYPYDKPLLSHEDMLKVLQVSAQEIISFLDKEKPDFLVMIVISSVSTKLLYHIAKKRGIKTIFLDVTRINNGLAATDKYGTFSEAEKIFERLQAGESVGVKKDDAIKFLAKFRASPEPYSPDLTPNQRLITRRQQLRILKPRNFVRSTSWIIKLFVEYFSKKTHDYTDSIPWLVVWDRIKRRARGLYGFRDFYEKPDKNDKYAFYPLHYEPEVATLLFAPLYSNDQIYLIKHIARSLPVGWKLYVKEHPSMFGYRPRKYYRDLKKIPNVKIIDPITRSLDLIQGARLVTVITGSAGFEAILLKMPVITFGDVFYNKLSMTKRCNNMEELPWIVQEQVQRFNHNDEELVNFISAIMEDSVEVDLITLWEKEGQGENIIKDEGLKNLAQLIAKKVGALK